MIGRSLLRRSAKSREAIIRQPIRSPLTAPQAHHHPLLNTEMVNELLHSSSLLFQVAHREELDHDKGIGEPHAQQEADDRGNHGERRSR